MSQSKTTTFSTSNANLFPARWRWRGFVIYNLLAALVLASWLWQPTRQWWDVFDLQLLHLLNAPLATNSIWAHVWAIGNMRPVDVGVGLVMLAMITKRNWIFDGSQVRSAFYVFLALLLLLLLIRIELFSEVVKLMNWHRPSPSLTVEGTVRLSELFPDWEKQWYMKDNSKGSFPGDHASVLFIWTAMLSLFARGRQLLVVWVITILYLLPRLVAGAHWASDDFVGGLFLSLVTFGWGFYTPYAGITRNLLENFTSPILRRLRQFPVLRNFSLISGR